MTNKHLQKLTGIVTSDKMQKTRVVEVTRLKKHPKYLKFIKRHKRYKAHDEKNEYHTGDKVIIQISRPLSRSKRWTIISRV